MHTLQYVATVSDTIENAFGHVKSSLEGRLGDDPYTAGSAEWFDWFVVGGGRYSTSDDSYDDNYLGDVAYQGSPIFNQYLDNTKTGRVTEMKALVDSAKTTNYQEMLEDLGKYEGKDVDYRVASNLYAIYRLYELSVGMWNSDSYFYDIDNETVSVKSLEHSIANGEKNWFLVPVDFHF